jgi:hypothetical protein
MQPIGSQDMAGVMLFYEEFGRRWLPVFLKFWGDARNGSVAIWKGNTNRPVSLVRSD